jgi:hypothetical protein
VWHEGPWHGNWGGWHDEYGWHGWYGGVGFCRALPYTYSYCAAYHVDHSTEPGYQTAIDLSEHVDALYTQINQMCGEVQTPNLDAALAASKTIAAYITNTVQPEDNTVSAMACGN